MAVDKKAWRLLIEMTACGVLALLSYYALVLLDLDTPFWRGATVFVVVLFVLTIARTSHGR